MNLKDAYEMGRYVARHPRAQGAVDRMGFAERLDGRTFTAYMLGRDRHWRLGEH